jgi:hypothetical protein
MSNIRVDGKTLGQIAFEAYRDETVTAYDGRPIPEWDALDGDREKAHRGWEAAAAAVMREVDRTAGNVRQGPYGPLSRPSRWRPLDEVVPNGVELAGEGMLWTDADAAQPADEAAVERSRTVSVEAEPDTDQPG